MPETVWKIHSENFMSVTNQDAPNIAVVLVAAGRGERAGGDGPKQYQSLLGRPIIAHTIERLCRAFEDMDQFTIQPVIRSEDTVLWHQSVAGLNDDYVQILKAPISGGATRQESVLNGLGAFIEDKPDYVFIHDAARPFVSSTLILGLLNALKKNVLGAIPALKITDTIVRIKDESADPVDRDGLYGVQTPQAFQFDAIIAAHEQVRGEEFTDDASVLQASGGSCVYTEGSENNFKITNPLDFKRAERQVMQELTDIRTGTGFDVHRFGEGDHVNLCGVKVPFHQSLEGHSDADVAMHALTDAILAALADGDIGAHFPPTDEQWRGADSSVFLNFAAKRVREKGGAIGHVGLTIICEAPKIRPHVDAMRTRLAEILSVDQSRISVQATTTEKLGFTGRSEGIAAQASSTIRLPMGVTS